MNKIKIAIIGCGRIFDKHYNSIIKLSKNYELVGAYDLDKKKNKNINQKYGIEKFNTFDELIKKKKPNLVSILNESGKHIETCKKIILKHDIRNFIIEKPLDVSVRKIIDFKKFIKNKKINIFTVKQNRFNKAVIKAKNLIQEKKLGKIFMISASCKWRRDQNYYNQSYWRGTRKLDGGVLMNQAIHHIDLLIYLCGDVEEVVGFGDTRFIDMESENISVASIKFKNKAIGVLEATTATSPSDYEGSITILGSNGTLKISGFASNELTYYIDSNKIKLNLDKYCDDIKNVYGNGHYLFYKYVARFLKSDKKKINEFDINSSLKSVMLVEKLIKSFKSKKVEKII